MRFSSRNGTSERSLGWLVTHWLGASGLVTGWLIAGGLFIGCGSSNAGGESQVLMPMEPASASGNAAIGATAAARTGTQDGTAAPPAARMSGNGAAGAMAPAGAMLPAMAMAMSAPASTPAAAGGNVAAGAASGVPSADTGPAPDATAGLPKLPPVMSVDVAGPFQTTQTLSGARSGSSGLFYPTELGKDGLKHPIFVWGCGGGAQPSTYAAQLTRIASHGFVVVAEVSMIGDNADVLRASIDWIIAENDRADSPFHDKLDVTKIAVGGHSIGSVNAFMVAPDPRLTTSIHVAGGSLDDVYDVNAPTTGMGGMNLIHPTAYICSQSDTFGNVEKTEQDYAKTTVPVFFTVMTGVDHVAAASEGLSAMVAWLRWQLGGESERRAMFLDPAGEFCTGKYVSRNKNW